MRLRTVKSTLHAFREYFACDHVTGLWHLRFSRHAAPAPAPLAHAV